MYRFYHISHKILRITGSWGSSFLCTKDYYIRENFVLFYFTKDKTWSPFIYTNKYYFGKSVSISTSYLYMDLLTYIEVYQHFRWSGRIIFFTIDGGWVNLYKLL